MKSAIEFDTGTGSVTAESGLGFSLDDVDGSSMRQIVNVSRIYNLGGSNNDSIIIGKQGGNTIYSDTFILAEGLLEDSAIIDSNLAVMNDLHAKRDAYIHGKLQVAGMIEGLDIYASNDMTVGNDLVVKNQFYAEGDANVDGTLQVKGIFHSESDARVDGNLNVDGELSASSDVTVAGNLTVVNAIQASYLTTLAGISTDGSIQSKQHILTDSYIEANGNITSTQSIISEGVLIAKDKIVATGVIQADSGIQVSKSIQMVDSNTIGSYCSINGLISRSPDGAALSCVNTRWTSLNNTPKTCQWRETGLDYYSDNQMHSITCEAKEVASGWRAYAAGALDGDVAVYCCTMN